MQIVTKCGIMLVSPNRPQHTFKHYDTSQAHIVASTEESLQVLGTDHVDLLLIHRPDVLMDPDEVAEAFTTLRQAGKVLHFGVSNFTPSQFDLLASRLGFPLVTNQIEVSVLSLDLLHDGTVDQCLQRGIAPMVWSPLAGGRIFDEDSEQAVRVRQALQSVGQELGGASLDQVALAWLLAHPVRFVPVLGSSKIERVRSAAGAEALCLSREQWFTIWSASTGTPVP
jgi:predicted oxidoreductase